MIDFLQQSGERENYSLADRLEKCAIYRRNGLRSDKVPNYCNLRFLCRSCSERIAKRKAKQFSAIIQELMFRLDLIPFMLTLKPKSSYSLSLALSQLETHLQKIRHRRKNHSSGRSTFTEFCRPQYLLLAIEIIRTQDHREWFPHIHALALNPSEEPHFVFPSLFQEWEEISGSPVRPHVKGTNAGRTFQKLQRSIVASSVQAKVSRQLRTVIEYPLKPPELCPQDRLIVYNTIKNKNLIRQWRVTEGRCFRPFNRL
jgi:hypothetical protein